MKEMEEKKEMKEKEEEGDDKEEEDRLCLTGLQRVTNARSAEQSEEECHGVAVHRHHGGDVDHHESVLGRRMYPNPYNMEGISHLVFLVMSKLVWNENCG